MKGYWKPSCTLVKWHFTHPRMCSVMMWGFGAMKIPTRRCVMPCRSFVRTLFCIEETLDGVTYMGMFQQFVIWRVGRRLDSIRFETISPPPPHFRYQVVCSLKWNPVPEFVRCKPHRNFSVGYVKLLVCIWTRLSLALESQNGSIWGHYSIHATTREVRT